MEVFFDEKWKFLGTKADLTDTIYLKIGVDQEVLDNPMTMFDISIAQRMS